MSEGEVPSQGAEDTGIGGEGGGLELLKCKLHPAFFGVQHAGRGPQESIGGVGGGGCLRVVEIWLMLGNVLIGV